MGKNKNVETKLIRQDNVEGLGCFSFLEWGIRNKKNIYNFSIYFPGFWSYLYSHLKRISRNRENWYDAKHPLHPEYALFLTWSFLTQIFNFLLKTMVEIFSNFRSKNKLEWRVKPPHFKKSIPIRNEHPKIAQILYTVFSWRVQLLYSTLCRNSCGTSCHLLSKMIIRK